MTLSNWFLDPSLTVRKVVTEITVGKSKAVVDLQRVLSFFIENDWLKLFHTLTTDVTGNSEDK